MSDQGERPSAIVDLKPLKTFLEILAAWISLFAPFAIDADVVGLFGSASFHSMNALLTAGRIAFLLFIIDRMGGLPGFGIGKPRISRLALGIGAGVALVALSAAFMAFLAFFGIADAPLRPGSIRPGASPLTFVPLLAISSLATAWFEELFFRSYSFEALRRSGFPPWAGIAIATILFALPHLYQGLAGMLTASFLGLLLSLLYGIERDVHLPAATHATYNFASFLILAYT